MKKVICVLLLAVMLMTMFTGCVGKFKCDLCREEKFGFKNEGEVLGITITYCNECKGKLTDLQDGIQDGLDDLQDGIQDGLDDLKDMFS